MHSTSSVMLSLGLVAAGLLELAPSALASSHANPNIQKRQALQPRHHEASHSHTKNRRHSKMAKKVKAKKDISVIYSGGGLGTLYYDLNGGGTCGPINGWYSYAETGGYAMCEPNAGYQTLSQRGSNRVVAIPSNMLQGNQAKYCGKEISVTYNGNTVNNLILWDGCAACNDNGGLDFSSTVFAEVFGEKNCGAGKLGGMTWEILDRQIWSTDGTPVADSGNSSPSQPEPVPETSTWSAPPSSSTSSTSTKQETSTWVEPTTTSSSSTWTQSEVSSSSKKPAPKPSKVSDAKSEEPITVVAPTKGKPVFVAKPSSTSTNQAEEAEPTTTTSIAEEKPAAPTSSATPSASPSPSAEPDSEEPVPAPSLPAETDGKSCNATPGVWQCSGNYLRQCVQTLSGWEWMNRVECAADSLINCDSPNPVCTRYVGKRRLPLH